MSIYGDEFIPDRERPTRPPRPARPQRTHRGDSSGGMIGDMIFPYCVAVPLDWYHVWTYTEAQIVKVLNSVNYEGWIPEVWDCDDRALKGVSTLKDVLKGCPCGMAIGEVPGTGQAHAVIIYWTSPATWKFWDPNSHSNVPFYCRYVIA